MVLHQPKSTTSPTVAKPFYAKASISPVQPFFSANSQKENEGAIQRKSNGFFSASPHNHIQRKLNIVDSEDASEKEAEVTADKVMSQSRPRLATSGSPSVKIISTSLQAKSGESPTANLQKKEAVHDSMEDNDMEQAQAARPRNADPADSTESVENKLSSSKGSGSSMDEPTRNKMESSFGADFSQVRIHTNHHAVQMNKEVGAHAFTHGSDIYFNNGKYNASSTDGQHLLAHELTHVVQQGKAGIHKKSDPVTASISKASPNKIQALPAVTSVTAAPELGVDKQITASAVIAAGTPRNTALTWSLNGAPAGVTITPSGRQAVIRANAASLVSAGAGFTASCGLTTTPGDTLPSANISLVGISQVTFNANPAFAAQNGNAFPVNTADPNRDNISGNTVNAVVTIAPIARPAGTTHTLLPALGASAAGNIITPGSATGTIRVKTTDTATGTNRTDNLIVNPVPMNLRQFTAQVPCGLGTYGANNTIAWTSSDSTGALNRIVGETITAGGRDDFNFTAAVNGGPNPSPTLALAVPANAWTDQLFTGSGANAGAAGDANMINVNRYVGTGVPALPRVWILRQGFHHLSWAGAWSSEYDHGTHRRSLVKKGAGFAFLTEHIFPKASSKAFSEPYIGPPLITLSNMTLTPLAPPAQGLAADGVSTASARINTTAAGRAVNWSVTKGSAVFTAGAAAGAVGAAATVTHGFGLDGVTIKVADTVFPNRTAEKHFPTKAVKVSGIKAAPSSVPTGVNTTTVSVSAEPGGRTVNFALDGVSAAAGVTSAPVVPAGAAATLAARSTVITRPAGFVGTVKVTASDRVIPAQASSVSIKFK